MLLLLLTAAALLDHKAEAKLPHFRCEQHYGKLINQTVTEQCISDSRCAVCLPRNLCVEKHPSPSKCPEGCAFERKTKNASCHLPLKAGSRKIPYDEAEAKKYVHLAGASYCPVDQIQAWTCKQCKPGFSPKVVMNNDAKILRGYIGIDEVENAVVIAFRGTVTTIKDWITDLDIFKISPYTDLPQVQVHRGFYLSFKYFEPQILDFLQNMGTPAPKIVVTGHSLGGAIATVCAFTLMHVHGYEIERVVTFGEPRDGDTNFASIYDTTIPNHWRVTHAKDIVPHVPIPWQGFYHVATEVWYPSQDYVPEQYTICDGSGEDPTCSDSVLDTSVDDHLTYIGIPLGSDAC
mmetsp:Transcript_14647/g.23869  ORF Transcript_14647/g.23869 Transcript_14647/m.23869 type:complete len:348 (+) Transcript_14647:483-1526(+)